MKLRVAILCMDPWRGGGNFQPFNLGSYRIQAAMLYGRDLPDAEVRMFARLGSDLDTWSEAIEDFDPHIIGASAYVWSFPALIELARRAKVANPGRLTIFGGPSSYYSMFRQPPFRASAAWVDAFVEGEGEWVVQEVLRRFSALRHDDLAGIRGLWLSDGRDDWSRPAQHAELIAFDDIPSPFQHGLTGSGATPSLEIFRGCPLACRFCQWGVMDGGGRIASKESLIRELSCFKDMSANGAYMVDAGLNLNAAAFRNLKDADDEVGYFSGRTLVTEVYPSMLREAHLELLARANSQTGIGLQSTNAEALKLHSRHFRRDRFVEVVNALNGVGSHTAVEIIVGLPGDTPDTFKRTLDFALSLNAASVHVFHCLVLPHALMDRDPEALELEYNPVTLEVKSAVGWSRSDLDETIAWLYDIAAPAEDLTETYQPRWPRPAEADRPEHFHGVFVAPSMWTFPRGGQVASSPKPVDIPVEIRIESEVDPRLQERLALAVATSTDGRLVCESVNWCGDALRMRLLTGTGPVLFEVGAFVESQPHFRAIDQLRFSHIGKHQLPRPVIDELNRFVACCGEPELYAALAEALHRQDA